MSRETKLKELLKTGRARCIFDSGILFLTKGKSYDVWGEYGSGDISVIDDSNMVVPYPLSCFEPINVSSKTTENGTKSSFESGFKVGDKVYKYGETDVNTVLDVFVSGYMRISNYPHRVNHEVICHATQENYEMLCKLYPHIEFEQPPKEITGSDLCRAMLDKGWHLVPCVVSDISDSDALNNDNCCLVDEWWVGSFDSCFNSGDYSYKYAVPFDPKTGIPLTEDVLNETTNK